MTTHRKPMPCLMSVYVEGARGHRHLGSFALGRDLSHMLLFGFRFPRFVGREVEGGGVIRGESGPPGNRVSRA
jgi:hypothetical protein